MVAPVAAAASGASVGAGAGAAGGAAGGLAGSGGAGSGAAMGAETPSINTPTNLRATGGPFNQQFGQQTVNQRYYDPKAHGYQEMPDSFVRPDPSQQVFPEDSPFGQFGQHGDPLPRDAEVPRATEPPQADAGANTTEPEAKTPDQRQRSAAPEGRGRDLDKPEAEAPDATARSERMAPEGRPAEPQPEVKNPASRIEQKRSDEAPTTQPPGRLNEPSPAARQQMDQPSGPNATGPLGSAGRGGGKGGWGGLLFRLFLALVGGDVDSTPVHEFKIAGSKDPTPSDESENEGKKNKSRKRKGRGPGGNGGGKGKGGGGSGDGGNQRRQTRFKFGKPDARGRRIVTETKPGPVKPERPNPNRAPQRRKSGPSARSGGGGMAALSLGIGLAAADALATIAQGYEALLKWEHVLTPEHEGMARFKLNQIRARRIEGTNVYINPKTGDLLVIGKVNVFEGDLWEPTVIGQLQPVEITTKYFRDPGTGLQVYQEQDGSWQAIVIPPSPRTAQ